MSVRLPARLVAAAAVALPLAAPAHNVRCGVGTQVLIEDAATTGEVIAVGRFGLQVATEADPAGAWHDLRKRVVRPVAAPDDRCVAAESDAVRFGAPTEDDDDPPKDEG